MKVVASNSPSSLAMSIGSIAATNFRPAQTVRASTCLRRRGGPANVTSRPDYNIGAGTVERKRIAECVPGWVGMTDKERAKVAAVWDGENVGYAQVARLLGCGSRNEMINEPTQK
jgi:hypothetical protein